MEQFNANVVPVKHYRLREVTNKLDVQKGFKPVKASSEMAEDA